MKKLIILAAGDLIVLDKIKYIELMRILKQSIYCLLFLILILCINSCTRNIKFISPPGYDLNRPVTIFLNDDLNEISGIIYYPKDTSIFAISDAHGSLYKIFPDRKTLTQKWKFGTNHDYEDLQLVDSTFYVMSSNGNLVSIKFSKTAPMKVDNFNIKDNQKNEFESLYFDSSLHQLVLVCKDCEDDKKSTVSTAAFNIKTNAYEKGPYKIDVKKINKLLKLNKEKFKPSAVAVNPLTQELYILASVNKQLVVADKNGNAKNVYALRPSLYNQPEGIAFTPAGDLLISNEASGKHGTGTILIIKYKK